MFIKPSLMDKMMELNPFAIAIFDRNGEYVKVNPAFLKLFKIQTPKDYSRVKFLVLIAKDPLEDIIKLKNGEIISNRERDYNPHEDDDIFQDLDLTFRTINFPILDDKYELEYIASMTQNITEFKQTQEELELAIQNSSVVSMISSIFIHNMTKIDKNIKQSLTTLGRALNANYCSIFQHIEISTKKTLNLKYFWKSTANSHDFDNIEELLETVYLSQYSEKLPISIYYKFNMESVSTKIANEMNKKALNSVLLLPVVVGSERYGTLVINREKIWRDYTKTEIKTALQTAILIGLALNNELRHKDIQHILDSLDILEIGIFIIQTNMQNKPKLKYFNAKFKEIYGFDKKKLNASDSFEDFISLDDISYVEKLYTIRQKGEPVPNLYKVKIRTAHGLKHYQLGIVLGLYEEKIASYGFLLEFPQEELKSPKEIYKDFA